jgi:hypothetical protein
VWQKRRRGDTGGMGGGGACRQCQKSTNTRRDTNIYIYNVSVGAPGESHNLYVRILCMLIHINIYILLKKRGLQISICGTGGKCFLQTVLNGTKFPQKGVRPEAICGITFSQKKIALPIFSICCAEPKP